MLDLDPGVHLQEEELPVLKEKLHRTRAPVVHRLSGPHGRLAHGGAELRVQGGGGRLLDELLVPTLDRALPLAQVHHVSVDVSQKLDLDVAGPIQIFFHVHRVVAEGACGLSAGGVQGSGSSSAVWTTRIPFPPPPAAALRRTGNPMSRATAVASSASRRGSVVPGTMGTPHPASVGGLRSCRPWPRSYRRWVPRRRSRPLPPLRRRVRVRPGTRIRDGRPRPRPPEPPRGVGRTGGRTRPRALVRSGRRHRPGARGGRGGPPRSRRPRFGCPAPDRHGRSGRRSLPCSQ
jgi:hypothetical protein